MSIITAYPEAHGNTVGASQSGVLRAYRTFQNNNAAASPDASGGCQPGNGSVYLRAGPVFFLRNSLIAWTMSAEIANPGIPPGSFVKYPKVGKSARRSPPAMDFASSTMARCSAIGLGL